jgi:hypothetical protein
MVLDMAQVTITIHHNIRDDDEETWDVSDDFIEGCDDESHDEVSEAESDADGRRSEYEHGGHVVSVVRS